MSDGQLVQPSLQISAYEHTSNEPILLICVLLNITLHILHKLIFLITSNHYWIKTKYADHSNNYLVKKAITAADTICIMQQLQQQAHKYWNAY